MKRLVLAVDCDDIIVETAHDIMRHYRETYGTKVPPTDYYANDLDVWGVSTYDEAVARVYKYMHTDEHQKIPPIKEAVAALRKLKDQHELHLVTGRADFLKTSTLAWIDEHFPGVFTSIEFTNFIVPTSHKHVTRSKADVARQLAADVFIEDHPHHAQIVADAGVQVLLMDYPWNRSFGAATSNVTRVRNWQDIVRQINNKVAGK